MYKVIDLFAGAGGLSLGFKQTKKFNIIAAAEINPNARATYQENLCKGDEDFVFINNVIGYDFKSLNDKFGGIDVVIGGPPCQGFSNANRQKTNLISLNNGLVKEYFRAIKQIMPKAFVMENVNMLSSDTHRFYESYSDNDEINRLISAGHNIPKRNDSIVITTCCPKSFDLENLYVSSQLLALPKKLTHLLSVLQKNLNNSERLSNYLKKQKKALIGEIQNYCDSFDSPNYYQNELISDLLLISNDIALESITVTEKTLERVLSLQHAISIIKEITDNQLIGTYEKEHDDTLLFNTNSYAVIDYVNAVLGGAYVQMGNTVCSEWYGVPVYSDAKLQRFRLKTAALPFNYCSLSGRDCN